MTKPQRRLFVGASFATIFFTLLAVFLSADEPVFINWLAKWGMVLLVVVIVAALFSLKMLGRSRTRDLGVNLAMVAATIAVCLGLGEIFVRYAYADITTTSGNSGFFSDRWRARAQPRLNRWNFREREIAPTPENGVYRIAVIGDSITYGQGIDEGERMTNILEARLNEMGRRFEVLNFGWPGAETIDHVAFLNDTVLGLKPNFVLLQWYVNDVEGHDKSLRPMPLQLAPSDILHTILWRYSALYNLAEIAWIKLQYATGFVETHDAYMKKRFADSTTPDSRAAAGALTDFIEMTEEHGIPMGIMLYPAPSFWRSKEDPYELAFLHDRVLETCTDYGITCLDLRAAFAEVDDPRSLEVSVFDAHPSARANRIMSEAALAAFGQTWMATGDEKSVK